MKKKHTHTMNASTKLGLVLLIIFTTCLFALILQLVYLLQRKRSFRQTTAVRAGAVSIDSGNSQFCGSPSSKELLYFFCCKNKPTRVEPSSGAPSMTVTETAIGADSEEEEEEEDELAKWQEVYGHSMVLYTIKEGEREGADSVEDSSGRRSETKSERRVCSTECLSGRVETANDAGVVVVVVEEEEETPCASSIYFTPSSSLGRDDGISVLSPESDDVRSTESNR